MADRTSADFRYSVKVSAAVVASAWPGERRRLAHGVGANGKAPARRIAEAFVAAFARSRFAVVA